ncbi:MAG: nucleotidyltransferase family protein [Nitrospirae bacterium]|nr:nucleotidyltransferase family protein [Magnetococcales bacterium]HAT49573.1 mannose-1-phosphate guanylyltransferase [Alphaproteobacteria bacterium]
MIAFILAAGRGERLRPLTDQCPKPLIAVDGHPVIDHTLARLRRWPMERVVVNTWHLADQLETHLARHPHWGDRIVISRESALLETGGGLCNALPLLGEQPILAINGDILWDFNLDLLVNAFQPTIMDALLVLVANPVGKGGDFTLQNETVGPLRRCQEGDRMGSMTYSGIQMIHPLALASYPVVPFSLNRFYDDCLQRGRLYGLRISGDWADIGTPESLARARDRWKFPLHIAADSGN